VTKTVGLIAGNGKFPIEFATAARNEGISVFAVAIREETDSGLADVVSSIEWVSLGELGRIIETFKVNGINEVVMAGKITKTHMYSNIPIDDRWKKVLARTGDHNDDSILLSIVQELANESIVTINSTTYLNSLLPERGILTSCHPTEQDWADMKYGHRIAKEIAGLDIGQTVVVKNCAVLAVEAIEGTDEAILRGGELGKGDIVIAKVSKPNQDLRFDVPVIGIHTIEAMIKARARSLIIDAGKTIFLDRMKVISLAEDNGIAIVAE
jgi:hypothetical protein